VPQDRYLELSRAKVSPIDAPFDEGITTEAGMTLPFLVSRGWSGPSGQYIEQWSLRRGGTEVFHRGPEQYIRVRGMQAVSEHVDRVTEPIKLEPGSYRLVFIVEGRFMGAADIEVMTSGNAAA